MKIKAVNLKTLETSYNVLSTFAAYDGGVYYSHHGEMVCERHKTWQDMQDVLHIYRPLPGHNIVGLSVVEGGSAEIYFITGVAFNSKGIVFTVDDGDACTIDWSEMPDGIVVAV